MSHNHWAYCSSSNLPIYTAQQYQTLLTQKSVIHIMVNTMNGFLNKITFLQISVFTMYHIILITSLTLSNIALAPSGKVAQLQHKSS